MMRVGFGFDVHRLVKGRDLWIGGILIPHTTGALGHSDADVLLHAICDSLLGAVALGDIGVHFPDSDQQWKGADSKKLLSAVIDLLDRNGWVVGNVDSTLVLERPKIMPYVQEMRRTIAPLMRVDENAISIKATTNEAMGFIGREEGISAYAIAMVQRKERSA